MLLRWDTWSFLFWFKFTKCWCNCFFFLKKSKKGVVCCSEAKCNIHKMLSLEVGHLLGAVPSAPFTQRSQLLGLQSAFASKISFLWLKESCIFRNFGWMQIFNFTRLEGSCLREYKTWRRCWGCMFSWIHSDSWQRIGLQIKLKNLLKKEKKSNITFADELNLTFSKRLNTHVHLYNVSVLCKRSHVKFWRWPHYFVVAHPPLQFL